jgi:signal transduction histidine kinase
MQDELLRSRMLISVGEMAAGAAHEMNNPLAVISGRSQLLASQLTDPRQRTAAKLIHEQSDRLSEIISELMDFAQPPRPTLEKCDVQQVVHQAISEAKVLSKASPDSADRTVEVIVTDVPSVTIDATQVRQALAELIANAIQATEAAAERSGQAGPSGAKRVTAGRVTVRIGHDSFSRRVVIDITDDGCGMNNATLRRAFDPFFSALPAGRRRGMGLPKALRWVEGSGGSIRLESEPNQGTRAIVLLPAAADQSPPQEFSELLNLPA